jgi:hypothetical protein
MNAQPCLTLCSLALLAPCAAAADVWVVGAGGLATIGEAIALASDGDIVLVHGGTYPGFTLAGKSLVIVADAGESVVIDGAVAVHGLTAAQTATLQGLRILGNPVDPALRATLSDGALWVEDCEVNSSTTKALQAVACASVVLRRSSFAGGDGSVHSDPGQDAVVLRELAAAVFSCVMTGGEGGIGGDEPECACTDDPGGTGGVGVSAKNCLGLLQASTIQGGTGGIGDCCSGDDPYCGSGGSGGTGLFCMGAGQITLVQTALSGGGGGFAGYPAITCSDGGDGDALVLLGGSVDELPLVSRSLAVSSPVREGQTAVAVASGEPFELLAIYASTGTALNVLPSVSGFQLLKPPFLLLGATVLPADGEFQVQATVPELGAAVAGLTLRLQVVRLPPTGGFVLGEPATLVLLDAAL